MFCAISGNAPKVAVVAKGSGHVFEKSLLEKYLVAEGKCPVTGEEMTMDDVVEVQAPKVARPRPASATSIPGMLTLFQDEWDALMLETYQLKTNLDTVRQELVKTLYQHDAACRVIARLVAERDEARFHLTQQQQQQPSAAAAAAAPAAAAETAAMDVEEGGSIPAAVASAMQAKFEELQAGRKGRKPAKTLATPEALAGYKATATHPLHTTTKPGIKCLAVDPKEPSTLVTGGQDGGVIVFDKESGKIAKTIKAHSKPVTSITVHPTAPALFSTSVDKTVKVWTGSAADGFDKGVTIKPHKGEVSGLSLHPTGSYFASASKDGTWAFTDIGDGGKAQTLLTSTDEGKSLGGYTAISFHPDGLLCGVTSASGTVQIYDVRKEEVVATLTGHEASVSSLDFSENGYYLATGAVDGTAIAWDLRKLQKNSGLVSKIDVGSAVHGVSFDYSGSYLAVCSDDVKVYKAKKWNLLATYEDHGKAVSATGWVR